jgi:hypothetical protein
MRVQDTVSFQPVFQGGIRLRPERIPHPFIDEVMLICNQIAESR